LLGTAACTKLLEAARAMANAAPCQDKCLLM
jgi:hypothetical protein